MNDRPTARREPLELNRTFLFLLVLGLIVVAWQRNRSGPTSPRETTPPAGAKPASLVPTNVIADRGLVLSAPAGHK